MNIYSTIETERGKTLGKGGQEYVKISLLNEYRKELAQITALFKLDTQEIMIAFIPINCQEFEMKEGKALALPNKIRRYTHAIN